MAYSKLFQRLNKRHSRLHMFQHYGKSLTGKDFGSKFSKFFRCQNNQLRNYHNDNLLTIFIGLLI